MVTAIKPSKKLTRAGDIISKLKNYAPVSIFWNFYFSIGICIYDAVHNKYFTKKFSGQARQKVQVQQSFIVRIITKNFIFQDNILHSILYCIWA